MNQEEKQVSRVLWASRLRNALRKANLSFTGAAGGDRTTIIVVDSEVPNWDYAIELSETADGVELVAQRHWRVKVWDDTKVQDLIDKIKEDKRLHQGLAKSCAEEDATKAAWAKRQQTELKDLAEIPWISYSIITDGPYAGRYHVHFESGNPFEFMPLDDVKALHALCAKMKWKQ